MKKVLALFALLVIVFLAISLMRNYPNNNPFTLPFTKTAIATIGNHKFNLLLAKSDKEREVGLSEKSSLLKDSGMLFLFDRPDYLSFWMKNMKFSIDIIYIKNKRIITIVRNAQPPKSPQTSLVIYKPDEPADTVLEINAGLSEKYQFKKGDEVKLENL